MPERFGREALSFEALPESFAGVVEEFVQRVPVGVHASGHLFERHAVHHHGVEGEALSLGQVLVDGALDVGEEERRGGARFGVGGMVGEGRAVVWRGALGCEVVERDVAPAFAAQLGEGDADGDFLGPDPACVYEPTEPRPPVPAARDITYGAPATRAMPWTPEAERRLERIPSFVRGVVASRVERFAKERGHRRVTLSLMREVRREMPVDFSRRLPFFARGGTDDEPAR